MRKLVATICVLSLFMVGCKSENIQQASKFEVTQPNVYSYDLDNNELIKHNLEIVEVNENSLFEELKKLSVISLNVELIDFEIKETKNKSVGILNVSKDILEMNLGSSSESLMLDSLSKTYMENFKLDEFVIKVEGKNYESGHFEISEENPIKR